MAAIDTNLKLPRNLYLEVTNRCNLKCKACILYRGSWESARDVALGEVVRITDQLPRLERIALHGIGEPLLNADLAAMIRHLKNRKAFVFFNSNGILLDEKRQDELIDAGLDELRISLDAANQQDYEAMRNSDRFAQIISNLRSFVNRMRQLQVTRPALSLWYLGTRENINALPEFVRLAADIGVTQVYLQRLVYFHDDDGYGLATSEKTLVASDVSVRQRVEQGQDLAKQLGVQFNASGLTSPLESVQTDTRSRDPWKGCFRPTTLMYITANGNVLPCCISPFSTSDYASIILGNVFETSLKEIWLGSKYRAFRKSHQTATPPKSCRGCGNLWSH
ncbi:MAG: radical SAM protein [Desulfobacterales bacterium]|jgi:radical SAM protein with 4Fe4S-binding SPASM domain